MKVKNIELRNFRNYDKLKLSLDFNNLVFLGNNAQGKTNLLEAIYYASTLRSFRTNDDFQLVLFDKEFCKINLQIERQNETKNLQVIVSENGKYIVLDGLPIKKFSDFIGEINAVLFTPNDLKQFYTSPKDRRKFIDIELGKISSKYLNQLLVFQKLLKERNAYLKVKKFDKEYFDILTEQLVNVEVEIMIARAAFLKLIEKFANDIYKKISDDGNILTIIYDSSVDIDDATKMKENLLKKYQHNFDREREIGMTLISCNREDFDMYLNGKKVIDFASQGQKRSCILALKLGLLEIIKMKINEYPIILLDDVLSELDETHRRNLFECIPDGVQIFVTATDIHIDEILKDTKYFRVEHGQVYKED